MTFNWAATLAALGAAASSYFPPPDAEGGWRTAGGAAEVRRVSGMNAARLDEAFEYVKGTSKHGGLLVVRHGWLVYERYFGRAHRNANANHASIGKSFTSVAVGVLLAERPDLFPEGLDQKIFTPRYMPRSAFPLTDERKRDIRLGQLLAMTAGIRGNNPGYVRGREVTLDPPGPDGWEASIDEMAFGKAGGKLNTKTLWCDPGEGYSYATSSAHLASIVLRHVTGQELEQYVQQKLAGPMGWGRWGWGNKAKNRDHTQGGGGIAPRPADMLRFGYLLLGGGRWGNSQLVPEAYARHCGRPSPYNPHFDYSLQFNVNGNGFWPAVPRDAFWKTGSGGFCIYVVPSLDLVVYKMAGRDDQYNPANTGVEPAPESGFQYDGSREGWGPAVSRKEDVYRKALELVVTAIEQ